MSVGGGIQPSNGGTFKRGSLQIYGSNQRVPLHFDIHFNQSVSQSDGLYIVSDAKRNGNGENPLEIPVLSVSLCLSGLNNRTGK